MIFSFNLFFFLGVPDVEQRMFLALLVFPFSFLLISFKHPGLVCFYGDLSKGL